jgi:hypothetical protein
LFLTGTILAGCGFGLANLGAFRTLSALCARGQRARLLATIYILAYLAFSIPVVIAGIAATHAGLHDPSIVYAAALAALAAAATISLLIHRHARPRTRVRTRARAALEVNAVRRVAADGAGVEALDARMRALRAVADGDWTGVVEADLALHQALVASAESPHLTRLYGLLEPDIRLSLTQQRSTYDSIHEIAAEHEPILAAVRDRAPARAAELLRDHIDDGASRAAGHPWP